LVLKRRHFIKTAALIGAGFAAGLPDAVFSRPSVFSAFKPSIPVRPQFCFPHGGCTEARIALFDKGPIGKDPFNICQ